MSGNERVLELPTRSIRIPEFVGLQDEAGAVIWDAALVLAHYLIHLSEIGEPHACVSSVGGANEYPCSSREEGPLIIGSEQGCICKPVKLSSSLGKLSSPLGRSAFPSASDSMSKRL